MIGVTSLVGAANAQYSPTPGSAQRAWAWVELPPFVDANNNILTPLTAQALNNEGHILARFHDANSNTIAAVYRDGGWKTLENPNSGGSGTYYAVTMNDQDDIIGYYGSPGTGVEWTWDSPSDSYVLSATTWSNYWLKDINDNGEIVGYDNSNSNDYPGAWMLITTSPPSWINLPGLGSVQHGTEALGLDDDLGGADIVGLAADDNSNILPVEWHYSGGQYSASQMYTPAAYQNITDSAKALTPYRVNNNDWAVGSVYDDATSKYEYVAWEYDSGVTYFHDLHLNGISATAISINNYNEIVAVNKLFYLDPVSGTLTPIDVMNFSTMHTVSGEYRAINRSTVSFSAINDNGWIACKGIRYSDNATVVGVMVPYNRNNNYDANTSDPIPDYREILADNSLDQSGGGSAGDQPDLVLDTESAKYMRVGMYPLGDWGNNQELNYIQIGRLHTDYCDLYAILNDTNLPGCDSNSTCEGFQSGLNTLFGIGNTGQPKQLIATIRCKNSDTSWGDTDYIPDPGSADETQKLSDLREICSKYCRDIDFVQLGNEIYGGPGQYYVNLGGSCGEGLLGSQDYFQSGPCYVAACDAVYAWMQKQADAVVESSALAGRPLEIISPAVFFSQVNYGYLGNLGGSPGLPDCLDVGNDPSPGNNRSAYSVKRAVDFANSYFGITDIHLHYTINDRSLTDNISAALDELEGGSYQDHTIWDPPVSVGCTEWSPIPTYQGSNSWMQVNGDTLARYMQVDGRSAPIDSWDTFVQNWLLTEFHRADLDGLLGEDLTLFSNKGLRFACYGQFGQGPVAHHLDNGDGLQHADPTQWQLTTISADMIKTNKLDNPNEPWNTFVEQALDSAASNFQVPNWDPHDGGVQAPSCGN